MIGVADLWRGLRMYKRSLKVKFKGFRQYSGSPEEICGAIVKGCWNGLYFQTSRGHFSEFWTRDFGMCAGALINLGYKSEVLKTLDYALSKFSKSHVATTISLRGRPVDFPTYSVDSLPFLFRALKLAEAKDLIEKYETFLLAEINYYITKVFDKETCMVKKKHFSSIKDFAKRKSSTYDNSMLAMLKCDLHELNFYSPLHEFKIIAALRENLWNGKYFYDDINKKEVVTGDANVFPFWTGAINSKEMFRSCLEQMKKHNLDKPFPLRYSSSRKKVSKTILTEVLAGSYERDSAWLHFRCCKSSQQKRIQ
jgi:hypothetical protein